MDNATLERKWPQEGFTRVPNWVYTDSELFHREMEEIFSGETWNYVGLACEVPEPGCFRRQWIGTRPVVMVRDKSGEIHVLENRCAHRQAMICWEQTGKVKDFTCAYHQWNFSLDGKLQGMPFKRGVMGKGGMPGDFDMSAHSLKKLRTTMRGDSVWATFSDTAPSFEEYCGPVVLGELDRVFPQGRQVKVLGYLRQLIPSNWKTYVENLKDPYHATLLHTFYITFGLWRADNESSCTPLGNGHSVMETHNSGKKTSAATPEMSRFKQELELNDMETVTPRHEYKDGKVGGPWVFPAATIGNQANSLQVRHVIPCTPDSFELVFTLFGYEDDDQEMQRLRLKHANLVGPAGFVSIDDSEMLKHVQAGVAGYPQRTGVVEMGGRDLKPTDYMVTEVLIRSMWDWYRQKMGL